MILVDTSVWIDHIRKPVPELQELLGSDHIVQHPMVTVELALGSIKDRAKAIGLLAKLMPAIVVSHQRLLEFAENNEISATGLGFVDVNLLATAVIDRQRLWTRDKRLKAQAERLGCAFSPT